MIDLDTTTVLIFSTLLIMVTSGLFLAETWARTDASGADRLWSVAFCSALLACITLAATELLPQTRAPMIVAANILLVLSPAMAWNGLRALTGRTPLISVTAVLVLISAVATIVEPRDPPWEGMSGFLFAQVIAVWLTAREAWRQRTANPRTATAFAGAMAILGTYSAMRFFAITLLGPESELFETYGSTELAALISSVSLVVTALALIVLRHDGEQTARAEQSNFDAMTGARTSRSFTARATEVLQSAQSEEAPLSLVLVTPESDQEITDAFGREQADRALVAIGERVTGLLPTGAILGRDGPQGRAFQALLPGCVTEDTRQWCEDVRAAIVADVFVTDSTPLRLPVSFHVATTTEVGYSLEALSLTVHRSAHTDAGARKLKALPAGSARLTGAEVEQ